MKTRGSEAFAKAARGRGRWWADQLQVDRSMISRYSTGAQAPGEAKRAQILALGGPPIASWDEPAVDAPRKPPPERDPDAKASPEGTRTLADNLQADATQLQNELREFAGALEERVRIAAQLASVVTSLGKLTGTAIANPRQILMSPIWQQIEGVITTALEPWPDAMRAAGEALRDLHARD